jgi:hypothetical protein
MISAISHGFIPCQKMTTHYCPSGFAARHHLASSGDDFTSRREVLASVTIIGSSFLFGATETSAFADGVDAKQIEKDKENILKGYKRLEYLLSNWEKVSAVSAISTTF